MGFSQLKDALRWIADYHQDLAQQYRDLAGKASSPRVQAVLSYLGDHTEEAETGLRRYLDSAPPGLLATWSRAAPDFPQVPLLKELKSCLCCSTVEDVTDLALRIHQAKDGIYETLLEVSDMDEQRELMKALRDTEQAETRRMVRDIGRFESC